MQYKKDYFGFVYIWYDKHRKKFCIGSHYGSIYDCYTSSTGHFKAAHNKRPQDFKRRILNYLTTDNKKLLLELEHNWLQMIKPEELGEKYYNLKRNASGGNGHANKGKIRADGAWNKGATGEMLALRRQGLFSLFCDKKKFLKFSKARKGRRIAEETKKKMSESRKRYFERLRQTPEYQVKLLKKLEKQKIKKPKIKKPRKKSSQFPWNKGIPMTEERKRHLSEIKKGTPAWNRGKPNPTAAENGRRGAAKLAQTVTGRKKKYREDGTWFWEYPNKKG